MMAASKQSSAGEDRDSVQPAIPDQRILDEITRSAQYATGASGAALILSDGKVMSCRACSGNLAPPVGTTLNTETGFTATCVREAALVRCDDTQTDPRVDGPSCIELGIGSILAVPIFNGPGVTGVLEVLSNTPQSFTDRHAFGLQLLGRLVETVSNYDLGIESSSTISDVKARENVPAAEDQTSNHQAQLTCLSCKQSNPQGSQFCNRCGVILFSFLGPEDAGADQTVSAAVDSSNEEDLKQIGKVITGNGSPTTWSEISKRLMADQTVGARSQPPRAAANQSALKDQSALKMEDTADDAWVERSVQETARLKTRVRTAVRRSLWL